MSPGDESMPRPDELKLGAQVGRWRVVESVGAGGQGAVYRVEDLHQPGDFYALKLALHVHDARAEREAVLMMTQAAHPHVVRFHGCARWPHPREGYLGFIMDWVPGLSLDTWAETPGTTFRQLAEVGATVAGTLGDLHTRGVLHRDLKPEHIRIRASDEQPVLLDFGVGWYRGAPPLTTGPLPPATLYLLSPEAVRFLWHSPEHPGQHYAYQPTDDLYALGVCLYRATTGHYPFSEWMPREPLQAAIVHARPQAPRLVNPRVPHALSDVIERLLAKSPSRRYSSGAALQEALVKAAREQDAEWDASIFEWAELPSAKQGAPPERHVVLPSRPKLSGPRFLGLVMLWQGRWFRGLALASALLLLGGLVLRLVSVAPSPHVPEEQDATDVRVGLDTAPPEPVPVPGREQKRAPCTEKLEVEMSGACWHRLWHHPPDCPPQTIAYNGMCLWPVPKPPALPTSLDGGAPDER